MAVSLQHNGFTIDLFDDSLFIQSADSLTTYNYIYHHPNNEAYKPVSKHGIVVSKNEVKLASAILLGYAGATSVSDDAIIIDDNNLVTRCCNMLFSLAIPGLTLNWMTEADWATCFSVHQYGDTYITHGEVSIKRIDRNGNTIWEFSGADIFVTMDGDLSFDLHDDYIALKDFIGNSYKIDYNGAII